MKLHHSLNRRALIIRYLEELALATVGLALILAFAASPAFAHGGGAPQLVNAGAGPYWVSVWTQPDPIRVSEFHVTVAVSEAPEPGTGTGEAGELVLDAAVLVHAAPVSQAGETLVAPATRDNAANKLFYEADLALPSQGPWRVDIQVSGSAGAGNAGFDIEVLPTSAFNTPLGIGWPLWAGLGLVLVAAGWWRTQMPQHRDGEATHA
jgi:hypothetical protein